MATKQFAYAQGDDTQTDEYLNGVAGRRVTNDYEVNDSNRTWYNEHGIGRKEYRNHCSRVIVFAISGLLLCIGIGVAVVGKIQKDKKILPLCPHCDSLVTAMYIFGGALCGLALLGLGSAATRFKPLAFLYAFFLFILSLACLAAGFAVVVFETGLKESEIKDLWTDAVKADDEFICTIQERLECSGFDRCCISPTPANLTFPRGYNPCNMTVEPNFSNWTRATSWYSDECLAPRCAATNNMYSEPCNNKVEEMVKEHFKPLIGVTFGLFLVLLITALASIRMTLKAHVM